MTKFYYGSMELEVPESVYSPEEDSLLLAKHIERLDLGDKSVLEVGCGSGFLSIVAAKGGATVTATDINEEAVEITKLNTKANSFAIKAVKSDMFSAIKGTFDLIIFNPPYLPVEEGETDPTYAGGKSGREVIERFAAGVKSRLKPNGSVLMVISSLTGEREVIDLFSKEKMKASTVAREKIPWEELIVVEAREF